MTIGFTMKDGELHFENPNGELVPIHVEKIYLKDEDEAIDSFTDIDDIRIQEEGEDINANTLNFAESSGVVYDKDSNTVHVTGGGGDGSDDGSPMQIEHDDETLDVDIIEFDEGLTLETETIEGEMGDKEKATIDSDVKPDDLFYATISESDDEFGKIEFVDDSDDSSLDIEQDGDTIKIKTVEVPEVIKVKHDGEEQEVEVIEFDENLDVSFDELEAVINSEASPLVEIEDGDSTESVTTLDFDEDIFNIEFDDDSAAIVGLSSVGEFEIYNRNGESETFEVSTISTSGDVEILTEEQEEYTERSDWESSIGSNDLQWTIFTTDKDRIDGYKYNVLATDGDNDFVEANTRFSNNKIRATKFETRSHTDPIHRMIGIEYTITYQGETESSIVQTGTIIRSKLSQNPRGENTYIIEAYAGHTINQFADKIADGETDVPPEISSDFRNTDSQVWKSEFKANGIHQSPVQILPKNGEGQYFDDEVDDDKDSFAAYGFYRDNDHDFITCISTRFGSEQWQYRTFGESLLDVPMLQATGPTHRLIVFSRTDESIYMEEIDVENGSRLSITDLSEEWDSIDFTDVTDVSIVRTDQHRQSVAIDFGDNVFIQTIDNKSRKKVERESDENYSLSSYFDSKIEEIDDENKLVIETFDDFEFNYEDQKYSKLELDIIQELDDVNSVGVDTTIVDSYTNFVNDDENGFYAIGVVNLPDNEDGPSSVFAAYRLLVQKDKKEIDVEEYDHFQRDTTVHSDSIVTGDGNFVCWINEDDKYSTYSMRDDEYVYQEQITFSEIGDIELYDRWMFGVTVDFRNRDFFGDSIEPGEIHIAGTGKNGQSDSESGLPTVPTKIDGTDRKEIGDNEALITTHLDVEGELIVNGDLKFLD